MKAWEEFFQYLLFQRHVEWAKRWVGNWIYKRTAFRFKDDLENIALIALWRACKVHDPERHHYHQFLGLATKMMNQRMLDFLRREWLETRHMKYAGEGDPYWDLVESQKISRTEKEEEAPSSLLLFPTEGRCREAAYLYFFVGLSFYDIGELLGCSYVKVHRILKRGMTLAREKLGVSEEQIEFVVVRRKKNP